MNAQNLKKAVLWSARIIGSGLLAFFIFMISAHLFGDAEQSDHVFTQREYISFVTGGLMLLGLAIAYFKEGIGAIVTIAGNLAFFATMPDLIRNPGWFGAILIPGFLYLFYWFLSSTELPHNRLNRDV